MAIDYIHEQIDNLKKQQEALAAARNININELGEERAKMVRRAQDEF